MSSDEAHRFTPDDLRRLGERASKLIARSPAMFADAATWFRDLKPERPTKGSKGAFPIARRLRAGWVAACEPFNEREPGEYYARMTPEAAIRIVLMMALLYDPAFDGSAVGLKPMPWDRTASDGEPLDSRRFFSYGIEPLPSGEGGSVWSWGVVEPALRLLYSHAARSANDPKAESTANAIPVKWPEDLHARFRQAVHHVEIALLNIQLVGRIDKHRQRYIDNAIANANSRFDAEQHQSRSAKGRKSKAPTAFQIAQKVDDQLRLDLQRDVVPQSTHERIKTEVERFRVARSVAERAIDDGCLRALDEIAGGGSLQASADALDLLERTEECVSGLQFYLRLPDQDLKPSLDRVPGLLAEYQSLCSRLSNAWRLRASTASKDDEGHSSGDQRQYPSRKALGWTRRELMQFADISEPTFRRLRDKSGVKSGKRGKKGRRYVPAEIKKMIDAAPSEVPESALAIERGWKPLLEQQKVAAAK